MLPYLDRCLCPCLSQGGGRHAFRLRVGGGGRHPFSLRVVGILSAQQQGGGKHPFSLRVDGGGNASGSRVKKGRVCHVVGAVLFSGGISLFYYVAGVLLSYGVATPDTLLYCTGWLAAGLAGTTFTVAPQAAFCTAAATATAVLLRGSTSSPAMSRCVAAYCSSEHNTT